MPVRVARSLHCTSREEGLSKSWGECTMCTWHNDSMQKWQHHVGDVMQDALVFRQNSMVKSAQTKEYCPQTRESPHDVTNLMISLPWCHYMAFGGCLGADWCWVKSEKLGDPPHQLGTSIPSPSPYKALKANIST